MQAITFIDTLNIYRYPHSECVYTLSAGNVFQIYNRRRLLELHVPGGHGKVSTKIFMLVKIHSQWWGLLNNI